MGCIGNCAINENNHMCCLECPDHVDCPMQCDALDEYEFAEDCPDYVEEQPTAFDAEKVLNKLKHEESEALRRYSESKGTAYAFSDKCSCDNWAKAIGIVKRGGRND